MKALSPYSLLACCLLGLCALSACATSPKAKKADIKQKKRVELAALQHYKLGIDAYTDDRYAEAEQQWKETLALDPNYPNAQDYVKRAESMQKAIKNLKRHGKKVAVAGLPVGVSGSTGALPTPVTASSK